MKREHLFELDTLKLFFAIIIFLNHYGFVCLCEAKQGLPSLLPNFVVNYGYVGVEFFFVLSGFLMNFNYKNKIYSFREFMVKRLSRIYPGYFFMFLVDMVLMLVHNSLVFYLKKGTYSFPDVWHIIQTLTLTSRGWIENTQNPYVGNGWFVCVLFICYILFYFARFLKTKYGETVYIIVCCMLALIGWGG